MKRSPSPSVEHLLREMRSSVAPVDSPEVSGKRRERTIESLRMAQLRGRERRETGRVWRRRAAVIAGVCIPTLAAAASLYVVRQGPPRAAVESATSARSIEVRPLVGHVDVVRAGHSIEAKTGIDTPLMEGDAVHTASVSRAALALPSGAAVEVSPLTNLDVTMPDLARSERIELALGRVDVSVPKLEHGHSLSVQTPNAVVTVHGTKFSVIVVPDTEGQLRTNVTVAEGAVLVAHDGRTDELHPGDSWSSGSERTAQGDSSKGPRDEAAPNASRDSQGSSPPIVAASVRSTSAPRVVSERDPADVKSRARHAAEFPDTRSSTLSEENALMERAMVSSRNGDDQKAVSLLDTLLSRYPSSILKENAEVERFRALRRLGNLSAASRDAERYLAEHPDGLGKDEARRLAVEPTSPHPSP